MFLFHLFGDFLWNGDRVAMSHHIILVSPYHIQCSVQLCMCEKQRQSRPARSFATTLCQAIELAGSADELLSRTRSHTVISPCCTLVISCGSFTSSDVVKFHHHCHFLWWSLRLNCRSFIPNCLTRHLDHFLFGDRGQTQLGQGCHQSSFHSRDSCRCLHHLVFSAVAWCTLSNLPDFLVWRPVSSVSCLPFLCKQDEVRPVWVPRHRRTFSTVGKPVGYRSVHGYTGDVEPGVLL